MALHRAVPRLSQGHRPMNAMLHQFLRFGLVGMVNTAVGLSVIYALMLGLGVSPALSNMAGYAVGLCVSFVLNSRWTFRDRMSLSGALRFLGAFAISYAANLACLLALIGPAGIAPEIAQLAAMVVYTLVFFLLSRLFVFRRGAAQTEATG